MKFLLWGLFAFATLAHAQGTVTDIDGNTYDYLTYGTQQWTVENAAMETYRDGTPIPQVTDATQWSNLTTGAWCYYDNDPTKGKLYNWYAVAGIHDNDPNTPNKEFAPAGWHVPTDAEWTTLEAYLIANGYNYDGTTTGNKIAKSMASNTEWNNSTNLGAVGNNQNQNNSSAFNAIPDDDRLSNGIFDDDNFDATFWSSSSNGIEESWYRVLNNGWNYLGRLSRNIQSGYSVRLIKDNNTCSEVSINASSTEACVGETVILDAGSGYNSYLWSTGETTQTISVNDAGSYSVTINQIQNQDSGIINLDGIDDWIEVQHDVLNNQSSGTVQIRCKFDTPTNHKNILFYGSENDNMRGLELRANDDGPFWTWHPGPGETESVYSNTVIDVFDWHTYTAQWTPNSMQLYVDGQLVGESNSISPNLTNLGSKIRMGRMGNSSSTYSNLSIDFLKIYSTNIYTSSFDQCDQLSQNNLILDYSFNTTNSSVVYDESSSGYDGILVNGPIFEYTSSPSCVSCEADSIIISYNTSFPPTGDAEQTFCDTATIADLSATGENIQWYDAATGGNLLDSTTVLIDGQTVYASQTVNGCESTDRLEVTVSIQDITLTASVTEVCAGESVDLSIANGDNIPELNGFTFVDTFESNLYFTSNYLSSWTTANSICQEKGGHLVSISSESENTFVSNLIPNEQFWIGLTDQVNEGQFLWADGSLFDYDKWAPTEPSNSGPTNNEDYVVINTTEGGSSSSDGYWNDVYNEIDYKFILELENSFTYLWSTGDTTENITVTPTETTEYWVDVTTNGVTCREYVTINVTAPVTPTGDTQQTFCDAATVADLTATGDNIQWYDAATGGNLLDSTTVLTDGQMVYASQTINSCESTDRLEVTVSIQDITLTASATEVCAGESVDLTVSSGLTAGSTACTSADLPANLQTGLVGYWPFCGNANDESGNGNNGTVNGATLTTDRFGNTDSAYNFDSANDYLTIDSNNNQLDFYGNCCITISGWINIENTNNQYGIFTNSEFNNYSQQYALKVDANNKLYFLSGNGLFEANGINYSASSVESNQWTHTAVTYDGSTLKLYLNGNLEFENQIVDYFPESPSETVFIGNSWGDNNELFPGDIDDLAIWNRALSASEIQQLANSSTYTWSTGDTTENITVTPTETTEYWVDVTTNGVTCREYVTINVTAPAAPTGDAEQTFCASSTVADLIATGDNIQWYDAATAGNLLDSTTALTDGQIVYASQTINSCESTDRLEVTVSIQDITITASATEVCAGESVDLSVVGDINSTYLWSTGESNFSGQGTLIDEYSLIANTVSQNTFSTIPGNIYRLEVSGTISLGGGAGNQRDVAYYTQSGPDGTTEGTPFDSACNLRIWTSLFCDTPGLRPSPDIYDASTHTYSYPFTANSSTLDVGFWDSPLGDNGPNVVTFKLYELSNSESTITVTPTETTEYWVDVTTNGVTCREYVTINVTAPAAPTGDAEQTFCDAATVADLTATGDNIQWYDAATGGNLLDSTTVLTDGQMVYASQTINSCESTDRLEVTVSIQDISITASATEVCAGESVDLGVTYPQQFNSWTHMVAVYNLDTDLLYFYINGVLSATSDISGIGNIYLTGGGSGSRKIGARAYSNQPDIYFWGDIDDVGVWDKPLSEIQVTDLYENQNICQVSDLPIELQSDLIAYYPFCNSLVDIGGGHNGTNFGATASTDRFGNLNSSFHFDGTSHVSIPTSLNLNNTSGGWTLSAWANPDFIANNIPNANYILDLTDGTANNNWGDRTALGLVVDGYRTGSHADNNISTNYGVTAPFSTPPSILWSTGDTTETISVTPTETTEYWVDVTTNGVTCREYVTINVTAPVAPTGDTEQTFCDVATIADLTATGDNIQWYDAATGGNLLDSTTALTNGQMVYASQTVNGCESIDRLEVTVSIQDITITASATEVCAGESVDLTVSSGLTAGTTACTSADLPANLQTGLVGYWPFCGNANDESGNGNNGTVNGATLTTDRFGNTDSAYSFDGGYIITSNNTFDNGWNEKTISIWVKPNNLTNYNQTIYITPGHNGESLSFNHANSPGGFSFWKNSDINVLSWDIFLANPLDYNFNNLSEWINIVITQQDFVFDFYINGSPDTELLANQNALQQLTGIMIGWSQSGSEYFNGDLDDLAIWNRALTPSEIQQLANSSTYNWSTGDTTANISVTPTETTEYWVDVTTNGVTCREYVTIDVTAPAAPTADAEQTFCNSATVADLIAAGDNIQWYDAATGGNLLNSTTVLTDGQMVYASQTVNGCESTDRLEVTVSIQDITITASATEVCAGESVDLTVSSGLTAGLSLDQFQQNNPDLILFHTIGNHSYFFKNEAVTWPQAKSFGDQIGVSMYVINNAAEELSVYNELPFTGTDGIQYWLGLYQDLLSADYSEPSGAWKWVDNSPLQYTNWAYLEPSNGFNNEDFAQFEWYDDGIEWNDAGNNENNNSCQCNVAFPIYEYIVNSSILWSTGESTANISVTPSETTEYWVDVTTNGVTCREYVTINVTAPAAPTGDAEQTFCTSSTVADLTATGDNIQWYDAATGGNLLNSTTVLTDGQMVYASQTVNGCESTDRLEVTVSIQDITITTSATEVCAGESVDLTVSSGTTSFVEGSLVGELNHTITTNIEQNFATQIGLNYRLEITGNFSWGTYCPNLAWDPAYTLTGFYGAQEPTPREMLCDSGVYSSIFCDTPGLRPIPDVYNDLDHTYNYYFVANSNSINVGFQDGNALGDNCGTIRYRLYENSTPANSSTYTWSTGDTTANISVTPTETTEYWVDVTTNGVTCREYVTINVSAPAAPTGPLTQTFCDAATVGDLTATGDNIQWYDAATGGNLLDSATALTDGQMVYASQTVNGCESTDRLEVSVSIQEITITASATEVCAGESVDLSVVGDINSTYLWSTGESNFSGQGTLIDEYSLIANTVSQNTFSTIPGNNYRLEVSGTISLGGGAGNQRDVAYYIQSGSDGTTEGTPFDSACNLRIWTSLFCDTPGLRPSPDIYDASTHTYSYPFTANSSTLDVGFWDSPLGDNGPNVVTFKLYELSNSESTITVSPTETTEYWVDVTTNGVTCREYVTIDVTAPAAPTGDPVQGGCSDFTVGSNNNAFTGENLQWYSTPSGGNALPDSHLLVDGTYYYISQTVDGCESSDRFEFLYLAPDPTITIDSPVICEGDSTTVSVSSSPSQGSTTFLWNTGETSESITLSPTESTTFWVDQIYNSGGPENIQTVCRYFFGITVDNAPEAPISGGDISECETITAQSLVATASADPGESITWYDAATGGSIVVDPSLSAAGTVTYYAEAINDTSGCASLTRTAVTLTITSVAAPTGDAVQSFCDNVNVSDLSVSGSNIQWYDAATGGNLLDPSSALSDGQLLYASQTENSCESITRLEVSVEIDIIPDPILITTELEFCLAREATLADLEVDEQGFALEWYDSFSGGNMLPMDTLLEDGVSYYATLYDATSGCESLMRLEVVPTVIPCEVVIYNAISLNDNGVNDYMVIENVEYFPDNSLEVYNRDGHLLYSQTQYGMGGNLFRGKANVSGIYNKNSNLPTGSYLYVFKYFNPYEQQQYTLKGFLTINSN